MKSKLLAGLLSCLALTGVAQEKKFTWKISGQVRGDLFYNSRANGEIVDGIFHLYPKDHDYDADGKDLNARANGSFYVLYTRIGVDFTGPNVGKAKTTAKIEADFRGSGSNFAMLRIRHAYIQLDWGRTALLVGQTWHSFFGEVYPKILNLSTGAPFNAFSRAPQIRFRQTAGDWMFTGSALWQLQYLSMGPDGKSESYIKSSCVPELYASVDYKKGAFLAGAGVEMLSLVPRTQNEVDGRIYKLDERITSVSLEAHAQYKTSDWLLAAKTIYGSNLSHLCMLSGMGVTSRDTRTGEQQYTPFRQTATWLNVVHGTKWKQGLFLGYMKNLGTGKDIIDQYGVGLEVGQLLTVNVYGLYELPHWKFGVEYSPSTAWFGDSDSRGRIHSTHTVTNHRVLGIMAYMF